MGRPLFSESYSTSTVRTEPQQTPATSPGAISYEKWNRWNAFDPDSDEFFNREDAVYEAFLDPADAARMQAEEEALAMAMSGVQREILQPESVNDILTRELADRSDDSSSSSSSSEGNISGRGSPMAVGSDDSAGMGTLADAYRAIEFEARGMSETALRYSSYMTEPHLYLRMHGGAAHLTTNDVDAREERDPDDLPSLIEVSPTRPTFAINRASANQSTARAIPESTRGTRRNTVSTGNRPIARSPYRTRGFIPAPPPSLPPSAPVPVPAVARPVTPPHQYVPAHRTPVAVEHRSPSPSPAPAVTPRLYSWSSRTPLGRDQPASPTPLYRQHRQSPFTNPGARMSLAHISPAPVRVRMV